MDWTQLDVPFEIIDKPLWYHNQGLSQTATGYGRKLNTGRMAKLPDGRTRRIYCTIYSNIGTCWIILNKERRIID